VKVSDTQTCLGLMAFPCIAKYPYLDLFDVETKVVVRAAERCLPRVRERLPPQIQDLLQANGARDFDLFFSVQDITRLVQGCFPATLNILYHAWAYPDSKPGVRLGYGEPWQLGAFTFARSGVRATPKVDMAFQTVSSAQIHVHSQPGGMCCSPNNGRIEVVGGMPISWFWTVALLSAASGEDSPQRVCVALHWLLVEAVPGFDEALTSASVPEVLRRLADLLGPEPCVAAAQRTFGLCGPEPPSTTETEPLPSQRAPVQVQEKSKGLGHDHGKPAGGKNKAGYA